MPICVRCSIISKCPGTCLLNPSSSHVQSINIPWEYLASNAKDSPKRVFPSCISALVFPNPFPCLDRNIGRLPLRVGGLKQERILNMAMNAPIMPFLSSMPECTFEMLILAPLQEESRIR